MNCEYCKNFLRTLSSLNYHKKNNKKCLLLQSKLKVEVESSLILCKFCSNNFSISNINNHIKICKKKKENLEKLLESSINENKRLNFNSENFKKN